MDASTMKLLTNEPQSSTPLAPTQQQKQQHPHHHHSLQLYDSANALLAAIATYAAFGFENGEGVLLIVSSQHRPLLSTHLRRFCCDLDRRQGLGQLVILDVDDVIQCVVVNGVLRCDLFLQQLTTTIDALLQHYSSVRVFDEVADVLLMREGNSEAAVRLERAWNELAERSDGNFSLVCAHNTKTLGAQHPAFEAICAQHSLVHDAPITRSYSPSSD